MREVQVRVLLGKPSDIILTMRKLILLFFVSTLLAQTKDATPKLTLEQHAKLRDVQISFIQASDNLKASPAYSAYVKAQGEYDAAVKATLKEAGVDQKKWNLNLDTLEFVPVPEKPAEKK